LETSDVTEVHAAVQREKPEPSAEVTPMPLWLTGVCGVAIAWAGMYFGLFMGGINGNVFNEYESTPAALFPLPATAGGAGAGAAAPELSLAQQGKAVYSQVCVACHQAGGTGVPGQYPPLAGSDIVQGSEKRVAAILLKGLQGPITVAGKPFSSPNAMPAWEAQLSPKKIAAVLSYIRSEWGNKAAEISEAKIVAAKKEFAAQTAAWSEATLHEIPEDATLPDAGGAAAPNAAKPAAAAAPAAAAPAAAAPAAGSAPAAAPAAASPEVLALGKTTYMTICIACHQPTGAGLPMVFPPLTKSPYVNGNPERFAAIILKGNMGAFTVDGKPFNNVMPPQEAMLTDDKIAATMTFVRANFGNTSGPVTPDVVAAARKKFADRKTSWTQPELDAWKDEAPAK
jgi:mono/diheme cytochrome c family protein